MPFDPNAYLSQKTAVTTSPAQPTTKPFDPDAYLSGKASYGERQLTRTHGTRISVEPEDVGGAIGMGIGGLLGGFGGMVAGSAIGQGGTRAILDIAKKTDQDKSIQKTEPPMSWGDVAYNAEQSAKKGFLVAAGGEAVNVAAKPVVKATGIVAKPVIESAYKYFFPKPPVVIPELPELYKMAQSAKQAADTAGNTAQSAYFDDVMKAINSEMLLNKNGGNLTRSQITQSTKDIKATQFLKDSSYGHNDLIKVMQVNNPTAIDEAGKAITKSVLPKGTLPMPPELVGAKASRPVTMLSLQAEKQAAKNAEAISGKIDTKISNTTQELIDNVDAIRKRAGEAIGEDIPLHPLGGSIDNKARTQIFNSKYEPLMKEAKDANAKVNVETAKIAAGIPPEQASANPVSKEAIKLYNDSVASGTPETTLAILRKQLGMEQPSTSDMENAIAEGMNATFTTDIAKKIVQKIPNMDGGIDFDMAQAVEASLGRASSKARSQGARDAARVIDNARFALKDEMSKTAKTISPDFEQRYKTVDYAYGQSRLYDEMNEVLSKHITPNAVTGTNEMARGEALAKYLRENAQDLERNGMSIDEIAKLANTSEKSAALQTVSGDKALDKLLEMNKTSPSSFKRLFPDMNPDDLKELQARNQKLDIYSKELGDMSKALQDNPNKAALGLLSDTNVNQANRINLAFKTVGPEQKQQLQYRMIEGLLNKSGNLADNINAIPEANWEAAFGDSTIKKDLLVLSDAIKLTTTTLPAGKPPRMLLAAERSPIVLAVYNLLRGNNLSASISGVVAEGGIVKMEQKIGQWLAKPNARKLFLQAIKQDAPEGIMKQLSTMLDDNAAKKMATEDTLSLVKRNFITRPAASNLMRTIKTGE